MRVKKLQKTSIVLLMAVMFALTLLFGANFAGQSAKAATMPESTAVDAASEMNLTSVSLAAAAAQHPVASTPYLDIRIIGKDAGNWIIMITNNNSFAVEVVYNYAMCFEGDAKEWKNLSHISSFTLAAGASTHPEKDKNPPDHVKISPNLFAGYIAVSFVHPEQTPPNRYRYISYANKLNTDTTMSVYYTSIKG